MNTLKQLESAPRNLVMYFWALLGAVVDDFTLITLLIFAVLLGFATSVLIAATAFFGLYFVLRLVANLADVIGFHANSTAQSNAAVAHAIAQTQRSAGTVVEGDILP